jgi:tetratricopeptide (TPR) repeat protein
MQHWSRAVDLINLKHDYLSAASELRSAIDLDPGFAAAWGGLAIAYGNGGEYDSAIVCMRRSLALGARLDDGQRAYYEGLLAEYKDDPESGIKPALQAIRLGWPNANQLMGNILVELGRTDEALAYYRRQSEESFTRPGPKSRSPEWGCLLDLGRFEEADSIASAEDVFPYMQPYQALASGQWARAESTGHALSRNATTLSDYRLDGLRTEAAAYAAQGDVTTARLTLGRSALILDVSPNSKLGMQELSSFLDILTETWSDPPWGASANDGRPEWRAYQAFRDAMSGQEAKANKALASLRAERLDSASAPYIELAWAALDFRAGRYGDVEDRLRLLARTGTLRGRLAYGEIAQAARWLTAQAFERGGVWDSSLVYCNLALEPHAGGSNSWAARAISMPFFLHMVVVLEARQGQYAEAEHSLDQLRALLLKPDEAMRAMYADASGAVRGAQSREGPAGRPSR